MLVKFKESFAGLKKQLIFIEKPLENPNADEVRALGSVPRTSTDDMIDALATAETAEKLKSGETIL